MKKFFLVGSLALAVFTACNKDNDNNNNNTMNTTDQSFMMQAAMSNKAEIMAGQVAATKGSNAGVKAFGQMMVMEHGMAQTDLQTLASRLAQNLPDSVDAEHQALMTRLNNLSGYSFDTAYINSQLKDHQKTIELFQNEVNNGSHDSVQNYATKYLPHLQMHLKSADSLSKAL